MPSPKSKSWYRKHAIAIAKEITRRQGVCAMCGRREGQMHGSHIMPEEYPATAADLDNLLCLCAGCHKLRRTSWHLNPVFAVRWLDKTFPGKADRLYEKAQENVDGDKDFWKNRYEELKRMRG
jgi:5-methylcytosine-specific restriction endonuclease McrA